MKFDKLFSKKGKHVAFNRLRQLRIVAAILLTAEVSLLGYGISGCSETATTAAKATEPEAEVVAAELRTPVTVGNFEFEKRVKTDEGEKLEFSMPYKYRYLFSNSLVRTILAAENSQKQTASRVDPSTIQTFFTEEEITEMNAWMEEPVSLSYEDIYTDEYLAELNIFFDV